MTIEPGTGLLHYTLSKQIGEGGMGAVWRATDTTLNRDVAIKILPQAFAEDQDRLARFEREAQTLASLNHPNIAAVYGLHQSGDTRFLAMELVEGEDLHRMLERGPLPTDQAIEIAIQIAAGVDAAHERGVVHRDLKPANVVRAQDGSVKVLDFGLAKSFGDSGGPSDLARSPTITSMGTVAGVILGTASYMSPEQARGQVVDQRTDVWAFGCVLYELLCGTPPFGGDTLTDVLASIVRAEPDWEALQGKVPEGIVTLLRRCLRKNPRERLRSVGDVGLTLKELAEGPIATTPGAAAAATPPVADRGGPSMRLFAGVVFTVAVLAAGLGYWLARSEPVSAAPHRFSIRIPEGSFLPAGIGTILAVSRDGSAIAFVAEDSEHRRLYLCVASTTSTCSRWPAPKARAGRSSRRTASGSASEPETDCRRSRSRAWTPIPSARMTAAGATGATTATCISFEGTRSGVSRRPVAGRNSCSNRTRNRESPRSSGRPFCRGAMC
jgi:hypothetical protein